MWYCSIKIQYIRIIPIPILGLRSLQARSLRREMRCWTLKMHHICIETRNPIYLVMGTVSIQTGWALAYPKNGTIKFQYNRIIPIPILGLRSLQARSLRREMRCWTLKMHHICIETRNPIYLVMGTVSIQTGWALAYPKNFSI